MFVRYIKFGTQIDHDLDWVWLFTLVYKANETASGH